MVTRELVGREVEHAPLNSIGGNGSAGGGVGSTISFWFEVTWEMTSFTLQPAQPLGVSQSASVS